MPMVAVAAVAAAVTVGATVMQISAQKKAAKEARKANQYTRQRDSLQSARQKMEAVREGRRAMAEVQQNAENQGVAGSSIGQGGAGSVYSQTSGNLSFLDRYGHFSDQASKHLQRSADAGATSNMWGGVAALGSQVFSAAGGIPKK